MPITATRSARFLLLQLELPGGECINAGVLLEDPSTDRLFVRVRRDLGSIAPDESEVLVEIESDLDAKAHEMGALRLIEYMRDTCSNFVQVTEPREVVVEDFDRALVRLYRDHVAPTVRPFVTHLPRYTLAAAAGAFLENQVIAEDGWEEAPANLRLDDRMFVARVVGRSMEPRIPDGSLCVFRRGVAGSRDGRLVLVEALGGGANDRYTVKRYQSEKRQTPEGWEHARVRLHPLNPAFEAWDLDPEENRYRILAEFVQVLD